jgi:hypothetical protein
MTFEVPVRPIEARRRAAWAAPMVAFCASLVTLVAVALAEPAGPADDTRVAATEGPSLGAGALGDSSSALTAARASAAQPHPRRLPATLGCEDLELEPCVRIARAALLVLPDEVADVSGGTVWRSLRCGDTHDCPPHYMRGSLPLGSVTFVFADGSPRAAINVVEWRHGPAIRLGARAWLVDWLPD